MQRQIEIFKTNVGSKKDAVAIVKKMLLHFPHCRINFDLEDCDRILRVEAPCNSINGQEIIQFVGRYGFTCMHLV